MACCGRRNYIREKDNRASFLIGAKDVCGFIRVRQASLKVKVVNNRPLINIHGSSFDLLNMLGQYHCKGELFNDLLKINFFIIKLGEAGKSVKNGDYKLASLKQVYEQELM